MFIQSGRFAAAGGGVFDPTALVVGCKLWADPTDVASFTFSATDFVSQWSDKSGQGNHGVQATGANQPRRTGTVNGLNVVATIDSTDRLVFPIPADSSKTLFVAIKKNTAPSSTSMTALDLSTSGDAQVYTRTGFSTDWNYYRTEASAEQAVGGDADAFSIVTFVLASSASLSVYSNGGAPTSTFDPHNNISSSTTLYVGGNNNGGDFSFGDIVLYDTALSTTDHDLVGNALAARWGTTWSATS